jgi:hypothetical protein
MAKYSKKSQDSVHDAMHEMKHGQLKSGRSGKKVTSRKQAIAIGLSESSSGKSSSSKSSSGKKSSGRKSSSRSKKS